MHYRRRRGFKAIFCRYLLFLWLLLLMFSLPPPVQAQEIPDLPQPSDQDVEDPFGQNTPYLSESSLALPDGRSVTIYRIGGPVHPLAQAGWHGKLPPGHSLKPNQPWLIFLLTVGCLAAPPLQPS